MSLISTPLFKTDNTEKLEAADAYDLSNTRPINKVWDATKSGATKIYDRAGGKEGIASGIQNLLSIKRSGGTGMQLLEAGLSTFGTSTMSLLKTAGGGILDKAAAYVDLNPETVSKIKSTGEGLFSRLQYGDASDLSNYGDLTTLIGDLTGQEQYAQYVNVGLESAVWGATFVKSVEYGAWSNIGDVKQYIDPEVYKQALVYSVPAVASSGSLEAVQELMKEMTADAIIAAKPDFVKTFLTQFKLPETLTGTMEAYAATLVTTLSTLQADWYQYKRRTNQTIVDLSALSTANAAVRQLLEVHVELSRYVIAAPYVTELTVDEVMRKQFPMMVTNLA